MSNLSLQTLSRSPLSFFFVCVCSCVITRGVCVCACVWHGGCAGDTLTTARPFALNQSGLAHLLWLGSSWSCLRAGAQPYWFKETLACAWLDANANSAQRISMHPVHSKRQRFGGSTTCGTLRNSGGHSPLESWSAHTLSSLQTCSASKEVKFKARCKAISRTILFIPHVQLARCFAADFIENSLV